MSLAQLMMAGTERTISREFQGRQVDVEALRFPMVTEEPRAVLESNHRLELK